MVAEVFAAEKIAELALGALVGTSVGKLTEGGLAKSLALWGKIKQRFSGQPEAATVLAAVEANPSPAAVSQVTPLLQTEMSADPGFAQELQGLARQVRNELNASQTTVTMQGESHDQSTFKQVGSIQAENVSF